MPLAESSRGATAVLQTSNQVVLAEAQRCSQQCHLQEVLCSLGLSTPDKLRGLSKSALSGKARTCQSPHDTGPRAFSEALSGPAKAAS